jgi:uncharacterized protein YbaP (TraB family)
MKHYIINNKLIDKGADNYQVCFEDMATFYQTADKTEINKMKTFMSSHDWNGFKKLIYQVLEKKRI